MTVPTPDGTSAAAGGGVLVTGGGGFIGGHLVRKLLDIGHSVTAVDSKPLERWLQRWDVRNEVADLRDPLVCRRLTRRVSQVYHLAADVGGVGYISRHHWSCATSAYIVVNILQAAAENAVRSVLFASSACVYPVSLQGTAPVPLSEDRVLPALPEGGYGWEKLYSELLCEYAAAEFGLAVRTARLFNVYGPYTDWEDDRAKAPAAICRKVAQASLSRQGRLKLWGDGTQRRSFLYVSDCVEGLIRLAASGETRPVNLASEHIVTIKELAELTSTLAGVDLRLSFDQAGPSGVQARVPDITRARQQLGWSPVVQLVDGVRHTYHWIYHQLRRTDGAGNRTSWRAAPGPELNGMEQHGPQPGRRTVG